MTKKTSPSVSSRNEPFVERSSTKIWQEDSSSENPYITETARCHGYNLQDLIKKRSFVDVLYLLFRSELPTEKEAEILEQLMIGLINPGPRHPATRAAMNAGVGKTDPVHILPVSLSIYGGNFNAAGSIEKCMRFLRKQRKKDPVETACTLLQGASNETDGDWEITPGFGSIYGGVDILATKLAAQLATLHGCGDTLKWSIAFSDELNKQGLGFYHTAVAAAVLTDLGFQPKMCGGLMQIFVSPGLLAHGTELANKPRTAMPYIKDENYVIE